MRSIATKSSAALPRIIKFYAKYYFATNSFIKDFKTAAQYFYFAIYAQTISCLTYGPLHFCLA